MERSVLSVPTPFNIDAADLYCEWQHWVSSFEIYSVASELADKDDKVQRATFLHCLGSAVQRIFRTIPGEHKKLDDVQRALEEYFAPKRNVVAERYKFRSREQKPEEPIDSYLTALRELAKSCEFGALEEEMIRDQIVEKCSSKTLRQKLLQQDELNLTKTMKVARSDETSKKDASLIAKGTKEDPIPVDQVDARRTDGGRDKKFICYRCGGMDGHSPDECGALNSRCNACRKMGHLARVCNSTTKNPQQRRSNQNSNQRSRKNPKKKIQVNVNGQKIRMIVDTGCKYNIISSKLYNSKFKCYELRPSKKRFIAYGQKESLDCKGYFTATIEVGNNALRANVYVIEVNAVQDKPKTSESSKIESLLREFDEIFHGIGKVSKFEHKIAIDPSVKPVSQNI
ncbi:hypothetical protein ACROYT_G025605 [Oculina patagonica]